MNAELPGVGGLCPRLLVGFDPESTQGFGLTLVRMLSRQLGGSFSISSRNGTRNVLEFAV